MSQIIPGLTRRRALYLMGGVAGGLTLHACTQSPEGSAPSASAEASPSEPVKAANGSTLWIGYSPLYIAIEKGFFKEGGLDLEHKVFSSTGEGNAALAAGRIQSINNVTSETVAFAAKGQDFRIVQVADTSLGGDGILARSSVADIADFKGRRVAVEIGSVSHFFLLQVLQEAGLTGDDVEITNVTPDAAAAAYTSGNVDIAVTYSPFLKQANNAQSDGRIIYDTSKMPTAIVDVYIFSTQFVQENPQATEAFVKGIFKAHEFLKTNKDEALAIVGKMLQLKPEEVEQELTGVGLTSAEDNLKMLDDPTSDIYLVDHMESLGQFLKAQNQIPEAPTADSLKALIDPTFVKAAQAT
ncbi:MAG: ABC transporter substrate-binding protein [Oculatellaceae cyanobacterium bins.114]|nr:ABC transporter substrate-binding protein [Oculatellaceae cyanobacterium bins.114]